MRVDKLFLKVTVCSLLTLVFYMIASPILGAFTQESAEASSPVLALLGLAVVVMAVYALLFIYLYSIRSGQITDSLFEQASYGGFAADVKAFLVSERAWFWTILCINLGSWLLINAERALFGKRVLTAVLLIYAPLNILSTALPDWLGHLPAYLLSAVILYLFYVTELALVRRATYKKLYGKK